MNLISLPIPEHIYERAQKIAVTKNQPVEDVLMEQLEQAFGNPLPELAPDERRELDALTNLSDEALWTIAREQMPEQSQQRQQVLMDANNKGKIQQEDFDELERLVTQGQRLMLRKAQAAALLTDRGHTVTPSDLTTTTK